MSINLNHNTNDITTVGVALTLNGSPVPQQSDLNLKANLNSPALTGTPTAPTAAPGTNTTQLATTAFVLASTSSSVQLLHIQDQKANGVAGGGSVSTTYTNRDLNFVAVNQITGSSLSSSIVTLPAGSYYVEGNSVSCGAGAFKLRLFNTTDSTSTLLGVNSFSTAGSSVTEVPCFISGYFSIASNKNFTLQYIAASTRVTNGLGLTTNLDSPTVEVYTDLKIWKLS